MRAIIIDDKDAKALLDNLELKSFQLERDFPDPEHRQIARDMHRHFHYVVCSWLQEQGADVVH